MGVIGLRQPSLYVPQRSPILNSLDTGYLLIETISDSAMLSDAWDEQRTPTRLENLQRGLAQVMIAFCSVPLPRIGSFRMDSRGYLHLDNRPLLVQGTVQENEGIPLDLGRRQVFDRCDDFVLHQIEALDNRLLYQPNSVDDQSDAWYQMTALTAARVIFPRMFRKELNYGPFVFTLTDLHPSNIFVDEDWNIKRIIDLEFACVRPLEFVQPPHWLTGETVDSLALEDYASTHAGFIKHIEREERRVRVSPKGRNNNISVLSQVMQASWTSGVYWATLAFLNPIGFVAVMYDNLLPHYYSLPSDEGFEDAEMKIAAHIWRPDAPNIVKKKQQVREDYQKSLMVAFDAVNETPDAN